MISFSIVLSKLVRIQCVPSSLLSSGPVVEGIICHVEIWNGSMLHLLCLITICSQLCPALRAVALMWVGGGFHYLIFSPVFLSI